LEVAPDFWDLSLGSLEELSSVHPNVQALLLLTAQASTILIAIKPAGESLAPTRVIARPWGVALKPRPADSGLFLRGSLGAQPFASPPGSVLPGR
jgi:hypothetical protein